MVPPAWTLAPLAQRWPVLRAAYPGLSWSEPARWHLTLAFLGELSAGQRHRLDERIRPLAAAVAPLPAALSGGGSFPSPDRARVLWVGVVSPGLEALAASVRSAAVDARIHLDAAPFVPHITIARGRRDVPASDVPHLLRKLAIGAGASWEISRVLLLESTGGPRPAYDERASWPLTGLIGDAEVGTDTGQ